MVKDREALHAVVHGVLKSQTRRWQRNRMRRALSPSQIHQKVIWMLINFHKTASECCWRYQAPRKTAQSLQKEVQQNIKDKTRDINLGTETHPREGVVKEVKFPHGGKPSHRHVCGDFWNLRGQHNWEENTKTQNMHLTAVVSWEVAQTLVSTTSKWGLGMERGCITGLRVRTGPECPEDNLRELKEQPKPWDHQRDKKEKTHRICV